MLITRPANVRYPLQHVGEIAHILKHDGPRVFGAESLHNAAVGINCADGRGVWDGSGECSNAFAAVVIDASAVPSLSAEAIAAFRAQIESPGMKAIPIVLQNGVAVDESVEPLHLARITTIPDPAQPDSVRQWRNELNDALSRPVTQTVTVEAAERMQGRVAVLPLISAVKG